MNAAREDWAARDLALVSGSDADRAQEAFGRLWLLTRDATARQLARRGVVGADADDVSQDVYSRLWRLREGLRATVAAEWYALVRTTTARALAERWANHRREANLEAEEEIVDADLPYVEAVLLANEVGRIFEAADDLWLGDVETEDAKLAVAALRLTLLDGLGQEEVAEMLGLEPERFEAWLKEPALLLRTIFGGLCWPSGELTGHLLRPSRPLQDHEIDRVLNDETPQDPPLAWDVDEARVVIWRVRHAMQAARIVRASDGALDAPAVESILDRIREAYPFRGISRTLRAALAAIGRESALASPGLWKRIAMEYHARHDLPHKHILERAQPPAAEAAFRLDAKTLDNWLSEGRIYSQLAARLRRDGE